MSTKYRHIVFAQYPNGICSAYFSAHPRTREGRTYRCITDASISRINHLIQHLAYMQFADLVPYMSVSARFPAKGEKS